MDFEHPTPLGVREGSQVCEGNLFIFSCLVICYVIIKRVTLLWVRLHLGE